MVRIRRKAKKVKTKVQRISVPKLKTKLPKAQSLDKKYKSVFSKAAGGKIK